MGAAIGGLAVIPQLSVPAGILGSVLSIIGTNVPEAEEVDHVGNLQEILAKTLSKLGDMLDSTRKDLLGYGNYGNLPNDDDAEHGNSVTQFFDSGRWLMHAHNDEITAYIDRAKLYIKQSLVAHMLKVRGFEVGIWDEIDGEMCVALRDKGTNPFETARHVKDLHVGAFVSHCTRTIANFKFLGRWLLLPMEPSRQGRYPETRFWTNQGRQSVA